MSFYLLLILAWCGVGLIAAMAMGRFIAAGRGGFDEDVEASLMRNKGTVKGEVARPGKREAA